MTAMADAAEAFAELHHVLENMQGAEALAAVQRLLRCSLGEFGAVLLHVAAEHQGGAEGAAVM